MNPELRRNLWLELTLHRLVALPVALVLAFLLAHAVAGGDAGGLIAGIALWLFAGLALWGGVQAADAVRGEVREKTWDGQRLSAIEPWTMTWGKLLGAPAYAWYGGVICLAAYLFFSPGREAPRMALLMVMGALLLHALALIGSTLAARRAMVRGSATAWIVGIGLVVVGPWISGGTPGDAPVAWWGGLWDRSLFVLASTALFVAWAVFGAYRLMCQELRVRTLPWAWVAFLVFCALWIAGFGMRAGDTAGQQKSVVLIAGLLVSLVAVYPLLFTEIGGAMAVRRLVVRVTAREWRRALQEIPLWPVTLALAGMFCILTVLVTGTRADAQGFMRAAVFAPVPLFLLVVRDAALCLFFALAREPRRAGAAALFYLLLFYWLVPTLLRAGGAPALADLVLPPFWERPGLATGVAAAQAVLMAALAFWRWRRNFGR